MTLLACALLYCTALASLAGINAWKSPISISSKVVAKVIATTAVSTIALSAVAPLPVFANTNPDAMEVRRVLEQPAGAPQPERAATVKLPSGLKYFDIKAGDGDTVEEGKTVQFQWVLRRQNGYFVDASANYESEPFIYKVGNLKKVIKGVDEGIRGMRVGGVRQLAIPAELAYIEGVGDGLPGPMPAGFGPRRQISTRQAGKEVWYLEVQVSKVR
jgi:hypothetical protein